MQTGLVCGRMLCDPPVQCIWGCSVRSDMFLHRRCNACKVFDFDVLYRAMASVTADCD